MPKDKRLFARIDLDYADHPKIAGLSDAAFRAHIEMILYSRKYLTDGRVANRVANRFGSQVLAELQSNDAEHPSLIALAGGDYLLHDYEDMQETKAEVASRSARNRANGRMGGRKSGGESRSGSVTESVSETEPTSQAETETETETETTTTDISSAEPTRADVDRLLDLLDAEIRANGGRVPSRTKKNRDAIRLMLDRDGISEEDVAGAIRWAQRSEFWRANILSASKLREKFDTLRLQAARERAQGGGRVLAFERNLEGARRAAEAEAAQAAREVGRA